MTADPTPLPPEGVTQADIDLANDYLSSAFRCTATLAERFAKARIAATSAAEGEVEALREEVEANRKDRVRWQSCALENLEAVYNSEARAAKAEAANARLMEALAPFAAVADEYDDGEDDSFEVWQDAGPIRNIRSTFYLKMFRRARSALDQGAEG